MDFNSFCDNKINSTKTNDNSDKQKKEDNQFFDTIEKVKKMKPDEMLSEFIKTSNRLKGQGKLTKEQIENIQNILQPMMTDEQREKMNEFLNIV